MSETTHTQALKGRCLEHRIRHAKTVHGMIFKSRPFKELENREIQGS